MIENTTEQALNQALCDKGLQMEIRLNLDRTYSVTINTSAHDKQIRAEALKPIAKILDDFVCGRIENSIVALNSINKCIYEQTKGAEG